MGKTSRVFYSADLHIGHRFVSGLRGFWNEDDVNDEEEAAPDTEAHDEWVAEVWDSAVREHDHVFLLGDLSINGGQHALDWIKARPGHKHLIAGNHDPVHPANARSFKHLPVWNQYFDSIQPFLRRKLVGKDILLSHFPYSAWGDGQDRPGSRYEQYRLPDMGELLLHGHTHGPERAHGHSMHVGIDAWKTLVPQETILEWASVTEKGTLDSILFV